MLFCLKSISIHEKYLNSEKYIPQNNSFELRRKHVLNKIILIKIGNYKKL